jgi:hypothetical protein
MILIYLCSDRLTSFLHVCCINNYKTPRMKTVIYFAGKNYVIYDSTVCLPIKHLLVKLVVLSYLINSPSIMRFLQTSCLPRNAWNQNIIQKKKILISVLKHINTLNIKNIFYSYFVMIWFVICVNYRWKLQHTQII